VPGGRSRSRRSGGAVWGAARDASAQVLAKALNPVVGFWDPLGLASAKFAGQSEEATIGFLRHAEIKHGRVAMAAFSGFCVQANGVTFPWPMTIAGDAFPVRDTPGAEWDAVPLNGKLQILGFIGFLEFYSEIAGTHYMRGGIPGKFPSFKETSLGKLLPVDLYDPAGLANMTPEKSKRGLQSEINNGRLAMIAIFAFLSESKIPGAVPALSFIKPYAYEYMSPFSAHF